MSRQSAAGSLVFVLAISEARQRELEIQHWGFSSGMQEHTFRKQDLEPGKSAQHDGLQLAVVS